jgi:peptidylprolyl isomerase
MKKINFFRGFLLSILFCTVCFGVYIYRNSDSVAVGKKIVNNIENTVYMETQYGRVVIRLLPEVAPNHVNRIKTLIRSGFYNGVPFHRVIEGFMVQTGDPTGTGTGGSGVKIDAEFSQKYSHKRGVVSMARAQDINSADSQFFIVLENSPFLDGNYTIFGYVVDGMNFVDKIRKGDVKKNGMVTNPDKIISMSIVADVDNYKKKKK